MIDTLRLTAEGAISLLERREVSAAELHAAYLAAIAERDGELHCYLRTCEEPSGEGIPIALKDVISTKGIETTAGSKILSGYSPVFDATVAARVKGAGLSLLGKTNTDEFAMGSSTENSAWGPSRNPWDPSRVPGGSGGGTAAAVSAGLAPWGLGSDTGGSIKQPSALCGNVGLRPTYGTVSRYGVVAFASSLDQIGPVAKTVRDVALLYSIIAGRDPLDSTTAELPEAVQLPDGDSLAGVRLAVPRQVESLDAIEPGVRSAFEASLERARELGAEVGECDLPLSYRYGMPCYYLVAPAEASSNLARYDGVRFGPRVEGATYGEMVDRTRDAGFGAEPKRRIMLGTYALAAGYYDAFYGQAQKVRTLLIREHREALDGIDAIVTPTSPTVAFPVGDKAADPLAMYACDLLTIPSCLAGLPGLSIPCGLSEGLPVGLQLIGRQFGENGLFRVGHALEQAIGFDTVPERAPMTWEPVIGLEIHVQLKTRTKMFCRCAVGFGAGENTQTCPVCLGFPGALPVMNRRAVEWTIKLGLALDCEIAGHAVFARKNYFYPDLPKGYQISQYDLPSCIDGKVLLPTADGDRVIGIVRAHLEEDAAKTVHVGGRSGRIGGADASLVDYNRGGTPLVEIVTAPDIRSADEAKRFLQLLRQTIVELGISDAEMEKGTLRVDANVSVRPAGSDELRTRTEIKNMNSFNFIARGIEAEVERQIGVWEAGDEVLQQTYDFDAGTGTLTARRSKEEADDYRYFPEPDLVPVEPAAELVDAIRAELPESPAARIRRIEPALDLERATVLVTGGLDRLWDETVAAGAGAVEAANVIANTVVGAGVDPTAVPADELAKLVEARERIPRGGVRRGDREAGRSGILGRPVRRAGGRLGRRRARPDRRPHPRGEPRSGRGLPRRQGRPPRVLRRSGHEGDGRQGKRACRLRPRPREARRLALRELELAADVEP